jgi:hypothetical protein
MKSEKQCDVTPVPQIQKPWHILKVKMMRVGSGDGMGQDLPYQERRYHWWSVGLLKPGRLFAAAFCNC